MIFLNLSSWKSSISNCLSAWIILWTVMFNSASNLYQKCIFSMHGQGLRSPQNKEYTTDQFSKVPWEHLVFLRVMISQHGSHRSSSGFFQDWKNRAHPSNYTLKIREAWVHEKLWYPRTCPVCNGNKQMLPFLMHVQDLNFYN